jgi:four helix bundle protein
MSKVKGQNHNSNVKTNIKLRAYGFSLLVIKFMGNLPNKKTFWVIGDQLLRSATSIGANIVEAKSSSSKREFIKYYEIALKSANETKYWLCLLRDSDLEGVDKTEVETMLSEAIEISNMLGSALLTLKGKKNI